METPVAEIRAVFAECEARKARFDETGKQADLRAWKRHGGVLEVVCVGHMRKALDEIERLRAALGQIERAQSWENDGGDMVEVRMDMDEASEIARSALQS